MACFHKVSGAQACCAFIQGLASGIDRSWQGGALTTGPWRPLRLECLTFLVFPNSLRALLKAPSPWRPLGVLRSGPEMSVAPGGPWRPLEAPGGPWRPWRPGPPTAVVFVFSFLGSGEKFGASWLRAPGPEIRSQRRPWTPQTPPGSSLQKTSQPPRTSTGPEENCLSCATVPLAVGRQASDLDRPARRGA